MTALRHHPLLALIVLALSACAAHTGAQEPEIPSSFVYQCPDGSSFVARYPDQERAVLEIGFRTLELPRVVSGSGARFQEGDVELWLHGNQATLTEGRVDHGECDATPVRGRGAEAEALGADLFAAGQEPGWTLVIDQDAWLRFSGDYGATLVNTRAPVRFAGMAGRVTFQARSDDGREIVVRVVPEPCADSMSGEPFTHTVSVQLGDRTFAGCGRVLGEAAN